MSAIDAMTTEERAVFVRLLAAAALARVWRDESDRTDGVHNEHTTDHDADAAAIFARELRDARDARNVSRQITAQPGAHRRRATTSSKRSQPASVRAVCYQLFNRKLIPLDGDGSTPVA